MVPTCGGQVTTRSPKVVIVWLAASDLRIALRSRHFTRAALVSSGVDGS